MRVMAREGIVSSKSRMTALGRSGLSSFRNFESIINFNAKIPYGTLHLGVSEQDVGAERKLTQWVNFPSAITEFELQLIDGHELLAACRFDQTNLHWLEEVERLKEWEKPALFYLMDQCGCDLEEALGKVDDVCLYRGRLLEAAETLFDEIHADRIPDDLKGYFDMEAFARDLRLGGDFTEFEYGDQYWTCTNANGQ